MSNQKNLPASISIFKDEKVRKKFEEMLDNRAGMFLSTVIQVVNSSYRLQKAEPESVLSAAAEAAVLNLSLNPNLGQAYIIPYNIKRKKSNGKFEVVVVAQFQIGYKGFIQLAQRSGMFKKMTAIPVFEGQFVSWNPLTEELVMDWTGAKDRIVGYAFYFRLVNQFEKTVYWTKEEVNAHAKKYSKSYGGQNSIWEDEMGEIAMSMKTVIKNTLSKYGPMSIDDTDLARALKSDQAQILEGEQVRYVDNERGSLEAEKYESERNRLLSAIDSAESVNFLEETLAPYVDQFGVQDEFDNKLLELQHKEEENEG
jgi:recombination protein RecT